MSLQSPESLKLKQYYDHCYELAKIVAAKGPPKDQSERIRHIIETQRPQGAPHVEFEEYWAKNFKAERRHIYLWILMRIQAARDYCLEYDIPVCLNES